MIRCDALIVGGGPAGSTCARALRLAGWDVVVADSARFPRDKVCAGWLTPEVFPLLELEPAEYRATGLTLQEITAFRTSIIGRQPVETRYGKTISYAIRRCEFDDFLLRRAGARLLEATPVGTLRRHGDVWIVNEAVETPVVVGAGGHFCPVARHMRGGADTSQPVVAKEAEVRVKSDDGDGSRTPELFFCRDLQGYGWYVRKGEYLNVGIGRRESRDFGSHVRDFMTFLAKSHGVELASDVRWRGHAYLASGTGPRPLVGDGILVIGDAAGLAYPESGEGIRPAIESGRLAAHVLIEAGGRRSLEALRPYADALGRLYPPSRPRPALVRPVAAAVGRVLMRSPSFTKHVLLDRWFLRRTA
jgi:geranylgeranyl reductase family protein